ncbi:Uncharacterised protein [Vibrio cholerae]|nr:Uncharacterised protein [Vibrio cholerae]CSC00529.1 Uncharacterised protein [Vibrio cholerae]CSD13451.1 Uncharacterised protein [Vibrio cholerae]CSD27995.1 Uncharacterised protein [Vibrio cholerae]
MDATAVFSAWGWSGFHSLRAAHVSDFNQYRTWRCPAHPTPRVTAQRDLRARHGAHLHPAWVSGRFGWIAISSRTTTPLCADGFKRAVCGARPFHVWFVQPAVTKRGADLAEFIE